ncbi:MAG TPA: UvrD-helicase domain-containing protein [Candidatus Kapabacteria bacterium]|nr:UvrD-helicase domain-containing protein [Candidatus Kapabacteria bacterium]
MSHFTREQSLALLTDRHIAVTANAGSGKTTVLVERFVRLLLEGVDIRSIVAITFTRKAAAEMRLRVAHRLENEFVKSLESGNEKQSIFLRHLRERLNIAQISTIHSFCAQILRDYPVEAHINPLFTALDEYDAATLREETIALVAEECLQSEDKEIADTYYRLFRLYGIETIHSIVHSLLKDNEKLTEIHDIYKKTDEEILSLRFKILDRNIVQPFRVPLQSIYEAIIVLKQSDVKHNSYSTALVYFLPNIDELLSILSETHKEESHFARIAEIISQLYELLFTTSGDPRKNLLPILDKCNITQNIFGEHEAFQRIYSFVSKVESWYDDKEILDTARVIYDFLQRCLDRINQEKIFLSALDFNDLQQKLLMILDYEEVRYDIQKRYSYIMVDEFQDTNKIQFQLTSKLIYALSLPLEDKDALHSNIYIVGDPKQSIYRFRGADVRVFESAKKAIIELNTKAHVADKVHINNVGIDLHTREQYGDIRLTTTFRLMPEIAFFVNSVCGSIMHQSTTGYFVGYDNTICSRSYNPEHKGTVSLIIGEKVREDSHTPPVHVQQDHALARHLLHIVASENPMYIEEKGNLRPVQWSDIVVVARKNDVLDSLAMTLRNYNIPCYVPQGKRFYTRQEIRDIVAYIAFLANPADDFAFTTIVRSPYFRISDTELLDIFYGSEEISLWEKSVRYCELHQLNEGNIAQLVHILSEVLPLSSRLSLPILLHTLLEKSDWFLRVQNTKDAERKTANIHKLIAFARDFESSGFNGLFEFSERLNALIATEVQESDAQIESSRNAIPLITIHSSKGLEFPVVIVYDMNAGDINASIKQVMIDENFGIICKPVVAQKNSVTSTKQLNAVITPLTVMASMDNSMAEEAEMERLLYVALTRAKDHLILVANITRNKENLPSKTKGMFSMVEHIFDDGYFYGKPMILHGDLSSIKDGELVQEDFSLEIPVIRYFLDSEAENYTPIVEKEEEREREILLDTIQTSHRDEQYSATKFTTFTDDPMSYYLHYAIGLPPMTDSYDEKYSFYEENDSFSGSFAGQLIHSVMQKSPQWIVDGLCDDSRLESIVHIICDSQEQTITEGLKHRIKRECKAISNTALLKQFAHTLPTAKFEEKYYYPIENDFLLAVFDCIIMNEKGEYEVWDWKTNVVRSQDDMDMFMQKYKTQLEMYAYFAMKLFPDQQSLTLRLLFTRKAQENASDEEWSRALYVDKKYLEVIEQTINNNYSLIRQPLHSLLHKQ